jgi:hypothetical protein
MNITIDDVSGLSYEELASKVPDLDGTIIKTRGLHVDPVDYNDRQGAKNISDAILKSVNDGSRVQTKAFTTASSLVPADLSLPIQERIYDVDIMRHLPTITGSGSRDVSVPESACLTGLLSINVHKISCLQIGI